MKTNKQIQNAILFDGTNVNEVLLWLNNPNIISFVSSKNNNGPALYLDDLGNLLVVQPGCYLIKMKGGIDIVKPMKPQLEIFA